MRRLLLWVAAVLPFVPAAVQFGINGIPDILFTGDGAALELGTRHAAHLAQLVGPYSRFGWNHPGPAFFYLALPFYTLFDQRGPALNVFALCVNLACALLIVLSARRLRGDLFALAVAAILASYELVAVPALLANEWNPIFPILPLLLTCFLALRLSLGETNVLPGFAFVASIAVQTHVGFAPAVLALCVIVWVRWRGLRPGVRNPIPGVSRRTRFVTLAILTLCWILPIYQAASQPPGNLPALIWFFLTRGGSQHTWAGPVAIVVGQLAVAPWAVVETLLHRPLPSPSLLAASIIVAVEAVVLVRLFVRARSCGDDVLKGLVATAIVQSIVAVVAVYSIRGFIYPHLVVWVTALGLLPLFAIAAGIVDLVNARFGERATYAAAGVSAAIGLALAVTAPIERPPLVRAADVGAESLARSVETFLQSRPIERPIVRIVSSEQWPTAVAIVLFLDKQGVPVYVEDSWINVVGPLFAAPGGARPALLVGGPEFAEQARARNDLAFVGSAEGISVFCEF